MKLIMLKIFSIILITVGSIFSQDGLSMLKIGHGALQSGMASAVVSIASDPDNTAYNPALAVGLKKFTASFGHTSYWENIRLESAYFGKRLSDKTWLHGGIRFAVVDELKLTTSVPSNDSIYFDAHDLSFKTGLAYAVTNEFTFGFSLGWFIEKIEAWRGSAFNIDFGAHYQANEQIALGASATNIGSDFEITKPGAIGSDKISLPKTYRVGGSYQYQKYLGAVDFVYLDEKAHLHLGTAVKIHPMFTVRSGYMLNYDSKNFTAGCSFAKRNLSIDYAFVPFSKDLGTSHMFNLSFSL